MGQFGAVTSGDVVALGGPRGARGQRPDHRQLVAPDAGACEQAAEQLAAQGVQAERIDLRTIWPWTRTLVLQSVAKTCRLLVVHEAIRVAGFGAEIAATVAEETGAKVARLGAPRIPVGYAPTLEAERQRRAHQRCGAKLVAP